jgi:hypothetical protein
MGPHKRIRLYEEKEVYVVDTRSPLFGSKLIVDFFLVDGTPIFRNASTYEVVKIKIDQISEEPPKEQK